ncbi:hypothetical protein ACFXGE_43620, partial [Streptomyces sp. NPDC059378]
REGGLDIVIANAAVIQVAPAGTAGPQAFRDATDTIFCGALHTALAARSTAEQTEKREAMKQGHALNASAGSL